MKLYLDSETYSETPISYGTYRYVQDCEPMIVTWAVDEGPVLLWDRTSNLTAPDGLISALENADEIWAHNAQFDRLVMNKIFLDLVPLDIWRCTLARALAHALPAGLQELCAVMEIPQDQTKHADGKRLMRLFCTPRPKKQKLRRATKETHPVEWQGFLEYAKADILALRAVERKMPRRNYQGRELALWHLDQKINDRGFAVDLDLAQSAIDAMAAEKERLGEEVADATHGIVETATQRDALIEFIQDTYGVFIKDLTKDTVSRLLDSEIPEGVRELLLLRQEASITAPAKFTKVIQGATGGRLRGTLQFAGAFRTARWAGRLFQPQNLARPTMSPEEIEQAIADLKAGIADLMWENVSKACSNSVRGVIIAPKGRKLVVSDLASIEGRGLAWLAGEEDVLQAYRDYDAGIGTDAYTRAYAASFNIAAEDVVKSQRQIGKVLELFLGYEGGVGAFLQGAVTYRFDVEAMAEDAAPLIPGDVWAEAEGFYDWTVKQRRPTFGLSRRAFIVCDSLKRLWRRKRPRTVTLWKDIQEAWRSAMRTPGLSMPCRKVSLIRSGGWMRIQLPSGRSLCYPHPTMDEHGKLAYMGKNQYTRQWCKLYTYGGKIVENITQAFSRDVLAHNMPAVEDAGYEIVTSVHDELPTETPDTDEFSAEGLSSIMTVPPDWAPDLPLAAAGYESYRYRKD